MTGGADQVTGGADRAGPRIAGGDPRFRADRGGADPAVTTTLADFAAGRGSEHAALTVLAGARLLVPVVARSGQQDDCADGTQREQASEMAVPAIVGHDGRAALPAFTCLDALRRWQHEARPVPVPAAAVWQHAVAQGQAVIVDVAGPVPLAVEGSRLAALAAGDPVPRLHDDADVRAAVAAVAAGWPAGVRVRLGPPQGNDADLTLEFVPDGRAVPQEEARSFASELAGRLAGRAPRGMVLVVRPG